MWVDDVILLQEDYVAKTAKMDGDVRKELLRTPALYWSTAVEEFGNKYGMDLSLGSPDRNTIGLIAQGVVPLWQIKEILVPRDPEKEELVKFICKYYNLGTNDASLFVQGLTSTISGKMTYIPMPEYGVRQLVAAIMQELYSSDKDVYKLLLEQKTQRLINNIAEMLARVPAYFSTSERAQIIREVVKGVLNNEELTTLRLI